jgi:hypothetical protein
MMSPTTLSAQPLAPSVIEKRRRAAFERALTRQADRTRRKLAVVVVALVAAVAAFCLLMATFDTV